MSKRQVQVLVWATNLDESKYEQLFHAGCAGIVPDDISDDLLTKAINAIFGGELWLPRKILSRLALGARPQNALRKLTPRETQIHELMSVGMTNQEIADQLFISRETVRWHLRSLHAKFSSEQIPPERRKAWRNFADD